MKYCIWRVSQTDDELLRAAFQQANAQRRARILALKTAQAQRQCLCADALARKMLAEECRIAPECLQFDRDENGKPFLRNFDIHFNLSHSGDYVLCAIHKQLIGADIEALREVKPSLSARICTKEEAAWCGEDSAKLLQVWTAKEAYLKYLGIGLRIAPREIAVIHDGKLSFPNVTLKSQLFEQYALSIVYD